MIPKNQHVLLIGASGLIGSHLLQQLTGDAHISKITLLLRRKLPIKSPKVLQVIVDFSGPDSWLDFFIGVDAVFCSIGTTRSKTPDLTEYRKIDFDIPTQAILAAEKNQVAKFMLVSSVGAERNSKNFYLKIKGEVEVVLNKSSIPTQGIFQPSLLLGERKEKRFGEAVARFIMPLFNFLVPMKYKAINAKEVASAMIRAAQIQTEKNRVYLYNDMID
jgi:uncharacterized protein YbjT (DUF2867 family)